MWSDFEEVNVIVEKLFNGHRQIFQERLEGCYLYGSLIWGDFDINTSDIDTLCVLKSDVTDSELEKLKKLHEKITAEHPKWKNRIEVHYAPKDGLKHFRETPFKMGNISPGEPLHMIEAGAEWLDEWYCVQEYAITVYGTDKAGIIPHIDKQEFIKVVRGYARSFGERIRECRNSCYSQAYAILTLCRALYTVRNAEQISKPAAARFGMEFLPEYKDLIEDALVWRQERDLASRNPQETYIRAEKFVDDILARYFGD